jgi:hypothetical protein
MNEKPLTEKQKEEKRIRDRELSDLRFALKHVECRRIFWRLMAHAGTFRSPYVVGDNGYETTYNVGRQDSGRHILNEIIAAKPDAFTQMQNENASEKVSKDNERKLKEKDRDILTIGE